MKNSQLEKEYFKLEEELDKLVLQKKILESQATEWLAREINCINHKINTERSGKDLPLKKYFILPEKEERELIIKNYKFFVSNNTHEKNK
ncbi:hypothetical protein IT400_00020 [Candidatus Nomurabacteria bacterium]|nr:hypothetical protein [Candidatus Nomurabacteria bacterium]